MIPVAEKEKKTAKRADDAKEKKKKIKIHLDMHMDQVFLDTGDAFVWLYDPVSW